MDEKIICAGFGGQGIMLLGKIIAQAAVKENKHVTWIPSYGAAMRGGTAFCMVIISDQEIASPYVDRCNTLFVFNQPSWDRFRYKVRKNGLVLLNSVLVKDSKSIPNVKVMRIPFTQIASSLGDVRVANMVALGRYIREKNVLKRKTIFEVFQEVAPKNKKHLVEINKQAIEKGFKA